MAEGDTNLQVYVASMGLLMRIMHGQIDQKCYFLIAASARPPCAGGLKSIKFMESGDCAVCAQHPSHAGFLSCINLCVN